MYVYPTSFFKVLNKGVKRGVICVEGREADTGVAMWEVRIGGRWMRRFVRGVMGARSAVALSFCSGSEVDVETDWEGYGASSSSSTLLVSLGDSFCALDALGPSLLLSPSSSIPSSSCQILYFLFSFSSFPSLVPVTPCISLPLIILLTLSHAASTSSTSNPATISPCVPLYGPSLIRAWKYVFSKLYARSG